MFISILILLLLSVAIGVGGYIIVNKKEDEEEPEPEPETESVPSKKGPQATKEAKETETETETEPKPEPKPAPVPKKPDPIDCVGSWSPWTDCTAKCNEGDGVRERSFTVQRKAEHGGSPCSARPEEKEFDTCKASKGRYMNREQCSRTCGTGQLRQEFVLSRRGHDKGASCPSGTKYVLCNTHPCPANCRGKWVRKFTWGARCEEWPNMHRYTYWDVYQKPQNDERGCPKNGEKRWQTSYCSVKK